MSTITKVYAMEFQLKFAPNYKWSKCGKCFNSKTGREINQSYKSRCIGYYIECKFYYLTYLRTQMQKNKKVNCPF